MNKININAQFDQSLRMVGKQWINNSVVYIWARVKEWILNIFDGTGEIV